MILDSIILVWTPFFSSIFSTKKEIAFSVPRIILLGPPASGKGTISRMVSAKLKCVHVDVDDLLKEADSNHRLEIQNLQGKKEVTKEMSHL